MNQRRKELVLETDEQLFNAIRSAIEVRIYVAEELDYTGEIMEYSDGAIKTAEGSYIRKNCIVKTTHNYFKLL